MDQKFFQVAITPEAKIHLRGIAEYTFQDDPIRDESLIELNH
ncbi:MAG: hypothetical protein AAGA18_05745 [Verrucomicrobiota bacterium]